MVKIDTNQFQQLAGENLERNEFCEQLMRRLVSVTGAYAGVMWNCADVPFQPIAKHSANEEQPLRISSKNHIEILSRAIEQSNVVIVRPSNAVESSDSADSPWILLAPVPGEVKELIELVVPPQSQSNDEKELVTAVSEVCRIASDQRKAHTEIEPIHDGSQAVENPITLEKFSQFVGVLHKTIDRKLTCANIVNESRRLLDCDRVSVLLWYRGNFRVFAISGQPSVNRRSNTTQLLERLARQVLKTRNQFWYPAEGDMAPQIKNALDEYLTISATRSLVIDPIYEKVPELVEDPESNERKRNPVIGGIIYEHCNEQWEQAEIAPVLEFLTSHSGNALRNAKRHHDMFLFPVWNTLGKSRVLAAPRVLPKTLMVCAGLLILGGILRFWPADFYVAAEGVLVPQERRWVFSETEGEVQKVRIDHGSMVKKGQELILLENENLKLSIEDTQGRIDVLNQQKIKIESQKLKNSFRSNPAQAQDSVKPLKSEIASLQRKLKLYSEIESKLSVTSPMNGQVITWDARRKLKDRTVQPAQQLLEIADPNGPWELVLDVEDRRVGHLSRSIKSAETPNFKVKFTLAADPSRTFEGRITELGTAMQLNEDKQQIRRVKVEIDGDLIDLKQAKSGVSAKIYSGETTSLGYLWLHDIPETLNRYVFFYFAD